MHEAMGAFLCEIPATSGFSASFESSFLEIRIHYPVPLAENTIKKPKKKVPPSKVRRNRQRLMKFLEKPEAQSDLPLASHKRSEAAFRNKRSHLLAKRRGVQKTQFFFITGFFVNKH